MNEKIKYHSDFLFSQGSFFIGVGSIFNIAGNYYRFNYSKSNEEADIKAIKSDWGMIKQDFEHVLGHINRNRIANSTTHG